MITNMKYQIDFLPDMTFGRGRGVEHIMYIIDWKNR